MMSRPQIHPMLTGRVGVLAKPTIKSGMNPIRHSGIIPNTMEGSDAGNSIV